MFFRFPMAVRPLVIDLSASLALLYAWTLAQVLFLYVDLPPAAGALQVSLVGLVFAARYVVTSTSPEQQERRERSGLHPLGAQWPWVALTALGVAVFLLAFVALYSRLIPPSPESNARLDAYLQLPLGSLPFFVSGIGVAPLVEEIIFRGWIQTRIARDFGSEAAIVNTAAVFAIAHLEVWQSPFLFLLGLATGYTVYLTGSVWSGVVMHAAYNTAILVVGFVYSDDELAALTSGARGTAVAVAVIMAAGAITWFGWRRQRGIRDRTAEPRAPSADSRSSPPPD
jgi:membrane protease YdiL (CAAX protease family)